MRGSLPVRPGGDKRVRASQGSRPAFPEAAFPDALFLDALFLDPGASR